MPSQPRCASRVLNPRSKPSHEPTQLSIPARARSSARKARTSARRPAQGVRSGSGVSAKNCMARVLRHPAVQGKAVRWSAYAQSEAPPPRRAGYHGRTVPAASGAIPMPPSRESVGFVGLGPDADFTRAVTLWEPA